MASYFVKHYSFYLSVSSIYHPYHSLRSSSLTTYLCSQKKKKKKKKKIACSLSSFNILITITHSLLYSCHSLHISPLSLSLSIYLLSSLSFIFSLSLLSPLFLFSPLSLPTRLSPPRPAGGVRLRAAAELWGWR